MKSDKKESYTILLFNVSDVMRIAVIIPTVATVKKASPTIIFTDVESTKELDELYKNYSETIE